MTTIPATTTCPEWCEGQHDEEPRHEAPSLNMLVCEFLSEDVDPWLHITLTERPDPDPGRSGTLPCIELSYGDEVLPLAVAESRRLAMALLTAADVADAPPGGIDDAVTDLASFLMRVGT